MIIRTGHTDKQRLAISLVENLQREDLNAIESALGYLRLMKEFKISQTDLSKVLGKSKSTISNTLRLLDLPDNIQKSIHDGNISEGHARAILMVHEAVKQQELFRKVVSQSLSVRDTEDMARIASGFINNEHKVIKTTKKSIKSADIMAIETSLQHHIGTNVDIRTKKDTTKGIICIHYYSLSDFDKIINILKK